MDLFPEIEPYQSGMLAVGQGHEIYFEQNGNPKGIPLVLLHGGPGSGTNPWQRRLFDPQKYRIILFDQRGAGKSTPHACLEHNTTPHLVGDIELLRAHLGIDSWVVYGGSWGSTLALSYADLHADKMRALVMYGIFLCRESELRDLYFDGGVTSKVFPDMFDKFINLLPPADRGNPVTGYLKLFQSPDKAVRYKALDSWARLEKKVSRLVVKDEDLAEIMQDPDHVLAFSSIENHYFLNKGFMDGDALLKTVGAKLAHIPVHIIQGRYDVVCPFITAWQLHKAVPGSHLHIVDNAGHTAKDPNMTVKILDVVNGLS